MTQCHGGLRKSDKCEISSNYLDFQQQVRSVILTLISILIN